MTNPFQVGKNLGDEAFKAAAAAKKAAKAARPRLSDEEIAALKARKAERIASGQATAPPPPRVKQDPNAQTRKKTTVKFFQGNQPRHLAIGIPGGIVGLGIGHHLSKSTKRDAAAVGAGATGGMFALDQADTVTGASLKRITHNVRQKAGPLNPEQSATLKAHQVKHGFTDANGAGRHPVSADSHAAKNRYFRSYPNGLPGARLQRLNSMRDRVEGRPVMAAGAVLGGAYVARRIHNRNKKAQVAKSDQHPVRHGALVGAGIGGTFGTAAGAHLGAAAHVAGVRDAQKWGYRVKVSRGKMALLTGAATGAVLGTYGAAVGAGQAHERNKRRQKLEAAGRRRATVVKSDRTKEVAAAAIGGGAGQGLYQGGGYATKNYVDARTRKGGKGVTQAQVNRQDKVLKPNKTKYGMRLPKGDPGRDTVGYHRNYPKELPHAGKIRLLGHTHEGRLGVLVGAGATAAGAATALAAEHHRVKKSAAGEIAGALYKHPTFLSELRRGASGGFHGQGLVHRMRDVPKTEPIKDAWGYTRGKRAVGNHGEEAKAAFKAVREGQARHSPHGTAFRLGATAGKTTASVGHQISRHPEYAISVPSASGGVAIIHHEIKRGNKKKGTTVAKSAFGVETIEKFGPPKVTVKQANITRHNEKKNKVTHYGPTKVVTESKGKTWFLRRPKYDAVATPQTKLKHGDLVAVSPSRRATHSDGGALARAHESNARTVTLPSTGLTLKHRRYQSNDTLAKADRRFKPGANIKPPVYFARHSEAAVKMRMLPKQPTPVAAAIRNGLRATTIAKDYRTGTITYHNEQAKLHSRKKASGGRQVAGGVGATVAGAAAHIHAKPIGERVGNMLPAEHQVHRARNALSAERVARRGGAALAGAGVALAAVGATRFVHHGRQQNKQTKLAQQARMHRSAELDATLAKSAFFEVEKNFLTSALKGGEEALHGFRGAFTGKATAARTPMVGRGKAVGAAAASGVGKLRPAGVAMTRTPARAAVSAGVSGAAIGSLATKNN